MKTLRLLLLPFGWIYGTIIGIRNLCYNWGIFKSYSIPKKSIIVGNLSAGGTGKTPLVDLILSHFVEQGIKASSLSRGYGRNTKGVLLADNKSTSQDIGDEPLIYKEHFRGKINVVVAEKRKEGAQFILNKFPDNEVIVLDDAFQHRAVTAGLNILVTPFDDLYIDDFVLPAGNLREWKIGANRADLIIVSKCPSNISEGQMNEICNRLNFNKGNVFFSYIEYTPLIGFNSNQKAEYSDILLVTGIGNPSPLIKHLSKQANVTHLAFKDHHEFKDEDIVRVHEKFDNFASRDKVIVTTEKDYMRLMKFDAVFNENYSWFYQPIKTNVINEQKFKSLIDEYVGKY